MTDSEDIEYFVAETAAAVRAMPLRDAQRYLHGLLIVADDDSLTELRRIYSSLIDCDAQLELLAAGQMKLPLEAAR